MAVERMPDRGNLYEYVRAWDGCISGKTFSNLKRNVALPDETKKHVYFKRSKSLNIQHI